jgi:ribosomal protein S18 acetylase RimI-like enzyme
MTVHLEPMTPKQYESWRPAAVEGYAQQRSDAGPGTIDATREGAGREFDSMLPDGVATPDHHLLVAYDDARVVGTLWLRIVDDWGARRAFVFDVQVDESQRGRGYGRAIMTAGEEYARDQGASVIALNVFAQNDIARSLYDKLGYLVTNVNMQKELI